MAYSWYWHIIFSPMAEIPSHDPKQHGISLHFNHHDYLPSTKPAIISPQSSRLPTLHKTHHHFTSIITITFPPQNTPPFHFHHHNYFYLPSTKHPIISLQLSQNTFPHTKPAIIPLPSSLLVFYYLPPQNLPQLPQTYMRCLHRKPGRSGFLSRDAQSTTEILSGWKHEQHLSCAPHTYTSALPTSSHQQPCWYWVRNLVFYVANQCSSIRAGWYWDCQDFSLKKHHCWQHSLPSIQFVRNWDQTRECDSME